MKDEREARYELWVDCWKKAIAVGKSRGVESTRLEIGPPATEEEVRQVEITLNLTLPTQFRQTMLEFSGRVNFFWFLRRDDNPPFPLTGIFCGGCSWDVSRLVEDHRQVVWLSENAFVENVPDETMWKGKIPFHSIACGDFIAVDQTSGGVVYLGHELAGSHAYWLGGDFYDFMDRWTALGCPDDDIWERFVTKKDGYIDLDHENSKQWCQWFGLPHPQHK